MTSRETGIYEWFDMLSGETDQTTFRLFLNSLDGYQGPPSTQDMIQLVNFVTGVRLHQMKETMKRTTDALEAKKESLDKRWPNWGDRPDGFDGPGGAE